MKTQDVPVELRSFWKVFEPLTRRFDYGQVFDDYLSMLMNWFTVPGEKGCGTECFTKYTDKERLMFSDLLKETILTYQKQISTKEWYDFFGNFYMELASRGKQSRLGQFFTPDPIVDMMVQIQGCSKEMTGKGLRINDPACGSGRFLISFHAHAPGNYVFGEDLDLICCKMSCINLLLHGCEGEIVHHNSLDPNDYIQGWRINVMLRKTGLPSIQDLPKEKSIIYQMWQNRLKEKEEEKEAVVEVAAQNVEIKKQPKPKQAPGQLTLF
jgi:type I restriction enzyme M protein